MIDEQTDKRPVLHVPGEQTPSQKLVLPAPSSTESDAANGHEQHTVAMSSHAHAYAPLSPHAVATPAHSIPAMHAPYFQHSPSAPDLPSTLLTTTPGLPYHATVSTRWRNDPAYKVLLAAIAFIVITGIVFTLYALNVFAQTASTSGKQGTGTVQSQSTPPRVTPQGTSDLHPAFPTPGGSTSGQPGGSSQPTPAATVAITPSLPPTTQPTQTPIPNNLTLQITSYPQQVSNGATVQVAMQASKPGVAVQLIVTYNAPPGFYGSNIQQTDNGGNASLSWHVRVLMHGNHPIIARVIAVARDSNGHIAQSQMLTVQITNGN